MTIYNPNDTFTDAEVLDLVDLVKGGSGGDANVPLTALADRTFYLLNRLMRYEDVKQLTNNYTYDYTNDNRKLLCFTITANKTFILPDVTSIPAGTIISIVTKINAIKALTVQCDGSQSIFDGGINVNQMYMHDGERLKLVAAANHWEIELADGNFKTVGHEYYSRAILRNSLVMGGSLINRQDVPRLSAFGLSLAETVADSLWLSDIKYQGFFSTGNTSTTIRIPDERSMFNRSMDLGRGLDSDRLSSGAGGYQKNENKAHTHTTKGRSGFSSTGVGGIDYIAGGDRDVPTSSSGGQDSRPENLNKYPLILY